MANSKWPHKDKNGNILLPQKVADKIVEEVMQKKAEVVGLDNKDQAQAFANFLWNEKQRHYGDIRRIDKDLFGLAQKWGVYPRQVEVWVEV